MLHFAASFVYIIERQRENERQDTYNGIHKTAQKIPGHGNGNTPKRG